MSPATPPGAGHSAPLRASPSTPLRTSELGGGDPLDRALPRRPAPAGVGRLDLLFRTRGALGLSATAVPALVFVPLGILLGPHALNVLTAGVLAHLDAVVSVALATLGIFVGLALDLRSARERRLFLAADVESLVTIGIVAGAVFVLLGTWQAPLDTSELAIALALGIAASASSGGTVAAGGNVFHHLASHIAELDDVMPIVAAGFVIIALQGGDLATVVRLTMLTALVGLLIAAAGWLLFEQAHDVPEQGVFVVGAVGLLGGTAAYLSLSPLLAGMVAGMFWRVAPGRAAQILNDTLRKIQHPLIVLLLLVSGASLEWSRLAIWLLAPFVLFRITGQLVGARVAMRLAAPLAAADLGVYLLPPGVIGIAFALNVQQVATPLTGSALLTAVTVGSLACELLALLELPRQEAT
jgi:hypothetical protein